MTDATDTDDDRETLDVPVPTPVSVPQGVFEPAPDLASATAAPDPLPPPPSAPYVPPAPPTAPPEVTWAKPLRPSRPVLGTALWAYGALLWAYLVAGEIVVWTPIPEIFGVLSVLAAFALACWRGTSQMVGATPARRLTPAGIAFLSWLVSMGLFTVLFSTSRRGKAEVTSLMLWFFAAIAYFWGRHLVALEKVPISGKARAGRVALWIVAALATLAAGANMIDRA